MRVGEHGFPQHTFEQSHNEERVLASALLGVPIDQAVPGDVVFVFEFVKHLVGEG